MRDFHSYGINSSTISGTQSASPESALANSGAVSTALNESGLQAALLAIVQQMPVSALLIPVALILVFLFLVTTGAGMTYSIAISVTGEENPPRWC